MRSSRALACAGLLALSCSGAEPESPRPVSMEPARGDAAAPVRVVIRGEGFLARPSVEPSDGASLDPRHRAWLDDTELTDVTWVDVRTLEATIPSGLTPGSKRLVVENAFARRGALDEAYEVLESATAALEASLDVAPATLYAGQPTTVTLAVLNAGGAAARDVAPAALTLSGDAATGCAVEGPAPATVARLEPGGLATFTWSVVPAVPGTLSLSSRAVGLDDRSSADVSSLAAERSADVHALPLLVATLAASRAAANVGQSVTATLTLANGGRSRADLTRVTLETSGAATSCTGPSPALPQSVAAGETLQLTWTCIASEPGALVLAALVEGVDAGAGGPISVTPATAAQVTVQTPAAISATLAVEGGPTTALVGASLAVTVTVSDTGQAGARVTGVTPVVAPANAATCGAASPAVPRTIDGLGALAFSWSCSAQQQGPLTLGATVEATDANTGAPLEAAAAGAALSVVVPAALTATITAAPSAAIVDQTIAVTLTLVNGGGSRADLTAVSPETSGPAASCTEASPPMPQSVAAGETLQLTWTCTASQPGTLALGATIAGADGTSGEPFGVTPAALASVTIHDPTALTVTSFVSSSAVAAAGQPVGVTLVVTNPGTTAAELVAIAPSLSPADASSCGPALPAPPVALAGGASLTFTWTCTPSSAGSYALGVEISATDGAGAPISLAPTPIPLTVEAFGLVGVLSAASPGVVDVPVPVTLELQNLGGAPARVSEVRGAIEPASGPPCTAAEPAPPQILPGAGTATFTWTCTGTSPRAYRLGATVAATDEGTGAALTVTIPVIDLQVTAGATSP